VQYDDNRDTSDEQNTKYDNISDTSNDSTYSVNILGELICRPYIGLLINRKKGSKVYAA